MENHQKNKKGELIKSSFELKRENLKFLSEIYKIETKTSLKISNKISTNGFNNEENKETIKLTKRKSVLYYLIILLLKTIFFKLTHQNSIMYKDSIITLKVSQSGMQNIFNGGTRPDEILIDSERKESIANGYSLNPTNIVKLIWTNDITDCNNMFEGCNSIIEINFTNFDATQCTTTAEMFRNCQSLISLDFSGFITSKLLKNMANMFLNCKSLISLNFSNFVTSEVGNFGHMLCNCESLKWVDVSNLNTEKVTLLDNMFKGCKNLTSVNLSNFNTSKMIKMQNMFDGCESLKALDFPNLDLTSVTNEEFLKDIF